jgi:DNA-binding NarL/FixJ family response regulator
VGVLVLSASLDLGNLRRATEAGADEILDKLTPSEEVVEAIRRLGQGERRIARRSRVGWWKSTREPPPEKVCLHFYNGGKHLHSKSNGAYKLGEEAPQ